jgi:hypothetical protein
MWMLVIGVLFFVNGADLAELKADPNLEKRSDKALQYAAADLDEARDNYNAGKIGEAKSALQQIREAVDFSYESLKETGKDPRKHPKHFKRAEVKLRELLRRLHGLMDQWSVVDRPAFEPVVARVQEVHDELLAGIMGRAKD